VQTLTPHQQHPSFDASAGRTPQFKETGNPARLTLRGVIVDHIISRAINGYDLYWRGMKKAGGLKRQSHWIESGTDSIENCLGQFPPTKARLEHVAMTLTAGKNWYGTHVEDIPGHVADYARCLLKDGLLWSLTHAAFWYERDDSELGYGNFALPDSAEESKETVGYNELQAISQGGNADRFLDNASSVCNHRVRFVTSRGMIGVGHEGVGVGDLVCVLLAQMSRSSLGSARLATRSWERVMSETLCAGRLLAGLMTTLTTLKRRGLTWCSYEVVGSWKLNENSAEEKTT